MEAVAPGVWRIPVPSQTLPPFDHTNSYLLADHGVGVWVDAGAAEMKVLHLGNDEQGPYALRH